MDRFLVLSNFFRATNRCANISHIVDVFKFLRACLVSNINYCTGLLKHGNHESDDKLHSKHKTKRQRNGHYRACVECLKVLNANIQANILQSAL